jgi:hypothetical membrane protein
VSNDDIPVLRAKIRALAWGMFVVGGTSLAIIGVNENGSNSHLMAAVAGSWMGAGLMLLCVTGRLR